MINIQIKYDAQNASITARGHAGYAEPGKDIVCAAVSTLLYTLLYSMELEYGDAGEYARIEDGYACIHLPMTAPDMCHHAFQTVVNGLLMLEAQYGDYIRCECE